MAGTRSASVAVFLCLLVVPARAAERFYLDSRGVRVELREADDRVVVVPQPGMSARLPGQMATYPGGLRAYPLGPDDARRPRQVAAAWVRAGAARWAGAAFVDPASGLRFVLGRDVIVRLVRPDRASEVLSGSGLRVVRSLDGEGATLLCRARDADTALEAAVFASGRQGVVWAVPDFILPVELLHRPDDTHHVRQWYLHQDGPAHIHAREAWDVTTGDPRVVVAVLDTGIEAGHPDLEGAARVAGHNAVDGGDDTTPHEDALGAHGTACAGVIAAAMDNQEGIAGVCPGCALMDVKTFDGPHASISAGVEALGWPAVNGAWVLSVSWVYAEGGGPADLTPYRDAIREATENGRGGLGAVVVFAAGNAGRRIPDELPTALPEVMAVGGTGPDDRVVAYSDYGPNLSVVAPTWTMRPEDPGIVTCDTLAERGHSREGFYWQAGDTADDPDVRTDLPEPDDTGNYTAYFSGTSASCPMVAGVLGLVFSVAPGLTGEEARFIVEQTADKVGGVDYGEDGHHDRYGHGRVNAARAVRAAGLPFDAPPGSHCTEDFHCEGSGCVRTDDHPRGWCGPPCEEDGTCTEPGLTCLEPAEEIALCLPACSGHQDCTGGTVCRDGGCLQLACQEHTDCPAGALCTRGRCARFTGSILGRTGCATRTPAGAALSWLLLLAWAACRRGRFLPVV